MKQFSLEEYLTNPNRKVVTREGRNARIICTDKKGTDFPIVVLVDFGDKEETCYYTENGYFIYDGRETNNDLFFAPEKHEGWINIFHGKDGPLTRNMIFASKEEAEESKRHCCGFTQGLYMTSVKVEWEE